ncbi:membrane protein [Rhodococcoides trifolii]|uniref:Membrane protein n=1 Tax=Rhodococcoides trifolii TaxID=908250 RepID=A0A917LGM0_9NOCA|nr:DUF1206 domain-containing protein [Rhodococcus trifolii]GGG22644.1 membrane protein [Rhodococcus trifolii]
MTKGEQLADRAQNTDAFEKAARAGHAVSGFVHLLIAFIIFRLAFGQGGNADQSGALGELAGKPGGRIAMWVAVAAFVALALWRVMEAIVGKRSDSDSGSVLDRLKAASLAVVYFAFAWSAFGFARGTGKSSGGQNAGMSARLMQSGPGTVVVAAAGVVVLAVGGYHIYKGLSRHFVDDLKTNPSKGIQTLGLLGYTTKGLALAGAGVLVVVAAVTSDPSKATGIDGAVKELGAQPFGQILLVLAAVGIALYGLYAFVLARWARM